MLYAYNLNWTSTRIKVGADWPMLCVSDWEVKIGDQKVIMQDAIVSVWRRSQINYSKCNRSLHGAHIEGLLEGIMVSLVDARPDVVCCLILGAHFLRVKRSFSVDTTQRQHLLAHLISVELNWFAVSPVMWAWEQQCIVIVDLKVYNRDSTAIVLHLRG